MSRKSPTSVNASRDMAVEKAYLNSRIKCCGIRAEFANPEGKKTEINYMDDLFSNALAVNGLVDAYTYHAMIRALGQAGEIDRALILYNETRDKNCFIHAAILQALRKNDRFQALFNIYCDLIRSCAETDPHIFSIVISAARENNQLLFARQAYQEASNRNQINDFVTQAYGNIDELLPPMSAAAASSISRQPARNEKALPCSVNPNSILVRAFYFDHSFYKQSEPAVAVPMPESGSVRPL